MQELLGETTEVYEADIVYGVRVSQSKAGTHLTITNIKNRYREEPAPTYRQLVLRNTVSVLYRLYREGG